MLLSLPYFIVFIFEASTDPKEQYRYLSFGFCACVGLSAYRALLLVQSVKSRGKLGEQRERNSR